MTSGICVKCLFQNTFIRPESSEERAGLYSLPFPTVRTGKLAACQYLQLLILKHLPSGRGDDLFIQIMVTPLQIGPSLIFTLTLHLHYSTRNRTTLEGHLILCGRTQDIYY